jgi:hypothetical protein
MGHGLSIDRRIATGELHFFRFTAPCTTYSTDPSWHMKMRDKLHKKTAVQINETIFRRKYANFRRFS